jgi:hypothetical protein
MMLNGRKRIFFNSALLGLGAWLDLECVALRNAGLELTSALQLGIELGTE